HHFAWLLRRSLHAPASTEIYTLSLHDALPISCRARPGSRGGRPRRARPSRCGGGRARGRPPPPSPPPACRCRPASCRRPPGRGRSEEHTSELQSRENLVCRLLLEKKKKDTEKK